MYQNTPGTETLGVSSLKIFYCMVMVINQSKTLKTSREHQKLLKGMIL